MTLLSKVRLFWEGHINYLAQSPSRFRRKYVMSKPWGRLCQIFVAFLEKLNFNVKTKMEISSNFFAYSECINFNINFQQKTWLTYKPVLLTLLDLYKIFGLHSFLSEHLQVSINCHNHVCINKDKNWQKIYLVGMQVHFSKWYKIW